MEVAYPLGDEDIESIRYIKEVDDHRITLKMPRSSSVSIESRRIMPCKRTAQEMLFRIIGCI